MHAFVNDLRQLSEVKAVSKANNYPGTVCATGLWCLSARVGVRRPQRMQQNIIYR